MTEFTKRDRATILQSKSVPGVGMTDEERKMLRDTNKIAHDLHKAFMEPSPTGEAPLIHRMSGVVIVVERSNWAARWAVRGFLFVGSAIGVLAAYRSGAWK